MLCCCAEKVDNKGAELVQVVPFAEEEPHQAAFQASAAPKREPKPKPVEVVPTPVEVPKPAPAPAEPPKPAPAEAPQPAPAAAPAPVPKPPPPATANASSTFTVDIERLQGTAIGLNLDLLDQSAALVTLVKDGGAVEQFNKTCDPSRQIKAGDRILEINGVKDNAKQIAEVIAASSHLKMVLRHPQPEFDVVLKKDAGTSLGVDLNFSPNSSLLITKIGEGPVKLWCEDPANINKKLFVRDRILAVNGIRGQPQDLINQLKSASPITLTVQPFE